MKEIPLKIDDSFIEIKSSGNGSCGPNSLAIIFCSYLFSDAYTDCSIDLTEFVHAWNLYYDKDQISCIKGMLDPSPEAIIDQIKRKLRDKLVIDKGGSFFDCENLIAPLARFYALLYREINSQDIPHLISPTSPVMLTSLGNAQAEFIKDDISNKVLVKDSRSGTTDNSPSYASMFDSSALVEVAEQLFALSISWGLKGKYTSPTNDFSLSLLSSYQAHKNVSEDQALTEIKKAPGASIFWFGPSAVESSEGLKIQSSPLLKCVIINSRQPAHFNAIIPRYQLKTPELKKILTNTQKSLRYDTRSDNEIYNPSGISPAPVVKITPACSQCDCEENSEFSEFSENIEQFFSYLLTILKWLSIFSLVISALIYFHDITIVLCASAAVACSGQKIYYSYYDLCVTSNQPVGKPTFSTPFGERDVSVPPASPPTSPSSTREPVCPTSSNL